MTDIRPLGEHACLLGESPLWHPLEACFYCVDIPGREILRWRAGQSEPDRWAQDAEPSCVAAHADGGLLVTRRDGLFRFIDGALTRLAPPPHDPTASASMTARLAPTGVCGWAACPMRANPRRCSTSGPVSASRARVGGLHVSNGLAWSPDGRRQYWSDTKLHRIYTADFIPPRVPAECLGSPNSPPKMAGHPHGGRPDGAAVDADGAYWSALFLRAGAGAPVADGRGASTRGPAGHLRHHAHLWRRRPAHALHHHRSAKSAPADELAREPWAGRVLTFRVDVPGLPANLVRA